MNHKYSDLLLTTLKAAGWYEGRRVNISRPEQLLTQWGFTVSHQARKVLTEFYSLSCTPSDKALHQPMLTFEIEKALFWLVPEDLPYITRIINQPLCPIAAVSGGQIWLIAESGQVVNLDDQWLGYRRFPSLAASLEEFVLPESGSCKFIDLVADQLLDEFRVR